MITLRLFHRADPFRQIESRVLQDSELTIGRDASADWVIADEERQVSRQHCVLSLRDGALWVRDISSNGVYLGNERQRIARDGAAPIACGDTIHLGQYMIVMEQTQLAPANDEVAPAENLHAMDAPFHLPMLQDPPASAEALAVPSDWESHSPDAAPPPPRANSAASDAVLLDAFCAGARLDASAFAGEDPVEVMRRIGAVYQQVVLGLGDLMSERSSVKSDYRMDRTTVGAADNNPFKWAPTQRVAIDLLRAQDDSFLSGPAALKASFVDLKKHLLCLMAGSRAAVAETLDQLRPQAAEYGLKPHALLFMSKSEACWRNYHKLHAELTNDARSSAESVINRAFKNGYELQLRQLDELGTRA